MARTCVPSPWRSASFELGKLLRWAAQMGLQFNEHIAEPGDIVFRHACKLGLEALGLTLSLRPIAGLGQGEEPGGTCCAAGSRRGLGREAEAVTSATPRPRWPPTWFTKFLARDSRAGASVFVIEAWVEKRWRPIAQSDYEASARRLFNQVSYVCPAETLLRLRRGTDVLIKMPADGRKNVRE
jgi:hypothetical protein